MCLGYRACEGPIELDPIWHEACSLVHHVAHQLHALHKHLVNSPRLSSGGKASRTLWRACLLHMCYSQAYVRALGKHLGADGLMEDFLHCAALKAKQTAPVWKLPELAHVHSHLQDIHKLQGVNTTACS